MANDFERPFPISKDALDSINSVSWFLMDAFWMLQMPQVGLSLIAPTALTGMLLMYIEKRRQVLWINIAINCWIWMNAIWMISDIGGHADWIVYSRALFGIALLFIGFAVFDTKNVREVFSHFRRFRMMRPKV